MLYNTPKIHLIQTIQNANLPWFKSGLLYFTCIVKTWICKNKNLIIKILHLTSRTIFYLN